MRRSARSTSRRTSHASAAPVTPAASASAQRSRHRSSSAASASSRPRSLIRTSLVDILEDGVREAPELHRVHLERLPRLLGSAQAEDAAQEEGERAGDVPLEAGGVQLGVEGMASRERGARLLAEEPVPGAHGRTARGAPGGACAARRPRVVPAPRRDTRARRRGLTGRRETRAPPRRARARPPTRRRRRRPADRRRAATRA